MSEIVYLRTGRFGTRVYHTDKECRNLTEDVREYPREKAESRTRWDMCKICADKIAEPENTRTPLREIVREEQSNE